MNYYIIGSKYGNQSRGFDDILPLMLKKGVIATGFNWHEDMQEFVGKTHEVIISHLKEKNESKESYYTLKHFLNLKPGDLVAVKIHSAPSGKQARLVIGAYAIVKGVDFPVYKHCDDLGHTIEVDFIETGLDYELQFGYGQTIHKIEDPERIKPIFGYYSYEVTKLGPKESQLHLKKTDDVIVEATAGYISSRAHNKIQNLLANELAEKHGSECVQVEKNFIDILVELEDKFILYEVKSYFSSDRCIREALGQILQYGHLLKASSDKAVEYVVVGPSDVDDSEDSYYTYVTNTLKEIFTYKRVLI
ncbi:hypothetical protein [Photobacterium damselae]|uniref:hypothetical protein n=1 Tax=Photobacterium damselae TaxID=38293 RepID=UPI001EDE512A|nr:hypothetical protein [Photobacterium damselae]MCG3823581.1 hypothetical protein [Photobacterium damselae]MCG9778459.1 hypothetical protein [Photobacterium damselae]